jgi:VanZ family protein
VSGPAGRSSGSPGALLDALRALGRRLQRLPRAGAPVLALAWAGLIFALSSISPPPPRGASLARAFAGNLFHALEYGVLALLLALALPRRAGWPALGARSVAAIVLACALYGVSDELHQSFVPGRDASALDVLTDLAGAAGALSVAAWAGRAEATSRTTAARVALSALLCCAAAAAATWGDRS